MSRGTRTALILLVLAVACYLIYLEAVQWHERTLESSLEQREAAWQRESERLEQEIFDYCQSPEFSLEGLEKLDRSVQGRWPSPLGSDQRTVRSV